jgi:Domain of unknown function (DUF1996)/Carbohydrate binding module (family 6)
MVQPVQRRARVRRPGGLARLVGRRPGTVVAVTIACVLAGSAVVVTSADALTRNRAGMIQAEAWSSMSGARAEKTQDSGGGQDVGWLSSGDWIRYRGVNLGLPGALTASVRVASAESAGGTLELRADSITGPVLAGYTITATGGWQSWTTRTQTNPSRLSGLHDVVVTLHSPQPADFVNLNWFSLVAKPDGTPVAAPTVAAPRPGHAIGHPSSPSAPSGPATGGAPAGPGPADPVASGTATSPAAAPAPMPSMTMTPGAPMPAAPAGKWVDVDPVKQAADTEAFFARTPKPVTGDPVRVPEFHAECTVDHHASDDPIVFPGRPGASHNHTFFGNTSTDADSTLASLRAAGTSCTPKEDKSAYWVPSLYQNGRVVDPLGKVTVYYGSRLKDPSRTQPFPAGFRMITGDARTQTDTPDRQGNHFWCAGIGGEIGRTADGLFPVCAPTAQLNRQITFADCWDGKHLDSPDHKSHVANGVDGECPAAFPVPIPNISFVIAYPLNTDTEGITLASGTGFSMHADFFNAWDADALAQRVRDCIDQDAKCDSAGNF